MRNVIQGMTKLMTAPASAVLLAASVVTLAPQAAAAPPQVTFEAFGSGTAATIDLDPSSGGTIFGASLPFSRTMGLPSGTTLLQIVVVGSTAVNPGCRITVDGKILAEKPVGGDAHCVADITGISQGDDPAPDADTGPADKPDTGPTNKPDTGPTNKPVPTGTVRTVTDGTFDSMVRQSAIPVAVAFQKPTCTSCVNFDPVFREAAADLPMLFFTMDVEQNPATEEQLGIITPPCPDCGTSISPLVVVFKDGTSAEKIKIQNPDRSLLTKAEFESKLAPFTG